MKKTISILASLVLLAACGNAATEVKEVENLPATETEQVNLENDQVSVSDPEEEEDEASSSENPFEVESVELSFKGVALGGIMKHTGELEVAVEITPGAELEDFSQTQIGATVDLKSIGTDTSMLTDHLMSEDYFEVETYPEATFESSGITENEDGTYNVTGDLTLKGQTRSITLKNVEVTDEQATANYELNLRDFGVVAEDDNKVEPMTPVNVVVKFK